MTEKILKLLAGRPSDVPQLSWDHYSESSVDCLRLWLKYAHKVVYIAARQMSDGQKPEKLIRAMRARSASVNIFAYIESANENSEKSLIANGANKIIYTGNSVDIVSHVNSIESGFYVSKDPESLALAGNIKKQQQPELISNQSSQSGVVKRFVNDSDLKKIVKILTSIGLGPVSHMVLNDAIDSLKKGRGGTIESLEIPLSSLLKIIYLEIESTDGRKIFMKNFS